MLAREGARVAITDVNVEGAEAVAASINAARKDKAIALSHDVTKEEDWVRVLAETERAFGGLHVLVNNAGIGLTKDLEQITLEEWRNVHAIDLDGVFLGCKHAVSVMARSVKATGLGGSIVNISSISGIIAGHNMAAYNSAKAGVRHLSKSVALYCARKSYGIRSNSVHPVFIATPILDPLVARFGKEEAYAKLARQVPLGTIGEPDDIAYAVLYLASDESKFVTGAELKVDGGISAM
jgi:NAD(P)-dependent dehydrogenase (short-subunit alcohol dehydrogenase family)